MPSYAQLSQRFSFVSDEPQLIVLNHPRIPQYPDVSYGPSPDPSSVSSVSAARFERKLNWLNSRRPERRRCRPGWD